MFYTIIIGVCTLVILTIIFDTFRVKNPEITAEKMDSKMLTFNSLYQTAVVCLLALMMTMIPITISRRLPVVTINERISSGTGNVPFVQGPVLFVGTEVVPVSVVVVVVAVVVVVVVSFVMGADTIKTLVSSDAVAPAVSYITM